nr:PREDICTED: 39S ribosomal protein L50, mitochondrial [Bemisia tabaci]
MAALVRHVLPNKNFSPFLTQFRFINGKTASGRDVPKSKKKHKLPHLVKLKRKEKKPDHELELVEPFFPIGQSIMARGFLRPNKPYEPPENVEELLKNVSKKVLLSSNHTVPLDDPDKRFKFFYECEKTLNYRIPNSLLHTMRTLRDVYEFYTTPVDTRTPYDALISRDDLPPNLHIQKEPVRYHPEDDSFFKTTVFPQSSTIVTNIKAKKKFKGYDAGPITDY